MLIDVDIPHPTGGAPAPSAGYGGFSFFALIETQGWLGNAAMDFLAM